MGEIHESQTGPSASAAVFPTLIWLPDVAWQFSPCPTAQQMDAFLRALEQNYPDVRSTACTKMVSRPGGAREAENLGASGACTTRRFSGA